MRRLPVSSNGSAPTTGSRAGCDTADTLLGPAETRTRSVASCPTFPTDTDGCKARENKMTWNRKSYSISLRRLLVHHRYVLRLLQGGPSGRIVGWVDFDL